MFKKIFLGSCLLLSLEIHPRFTKFISKILYQKITLKAELNQQLLDAVVDISSEKVSNLLQKGANPNSYQGNNGILSMAIYRINCAVQSNDEENIDDSVQILKKLLSAGINTKPIDTYDCIQHVELISKNATKHPYLTHLHIYEEILELLHQHRKK